MFQHTDSSIHRWIFSYNPWHNICTGALDFSFVALVQEPKGSTVHTPSVVRGKLWKAENRVARASKKRPEWTKSIPRWWLWHCSWCPKNFCKIHLICILTGNCRRHNQPQMYMMMLSYMSLFKLFQHNTPAYGNYCVEAEFAEIVRGLCHSILQNVHSVWNVTTTFFLESKYICAKGVRNVPTAKQ